MTPLSRKTIVRASLITLCLVLIIGLTVYWLWPKSYVNLIPAQAKAVVRLDVTKMDQLKGRANPLEQLGGLQPNGMDLSEPAYAFVTPNEYVGLAIKMGSKATFDQGIETLIKERKSQALESYEGWSWAWLNAGWYVCWNERALLLLGPGVAGEKDQLRQTMVALINTSDDFSSTVSFKKLEEQQGCIRLFAQLDALPTPYNLLFRLSVPTDCDPAAVQVFASAELKKKANGSQQTLIQSEMTSENADILSAITAYEDQKGCIASPPPAATDTTLFSIATRTQGKPLLQLLKADATLRGLLMGLNQTIDADKMLSATDGLFTIEISQLNKDWTPSFCIKAETQSGKLFSDASYWMESARKQKDVQLKQTSAETFCLSSEKQQLCFGRNASNSLLYFATPNMEAQAQRPFFTQKSEDQEGTLVYFHVNLQKLFTQPCVASSGMAQLFKTLLPGSKSLTYTANTQRKACLTIE